MRLSSAAQAGCRVVVPEYRLAPEHAHPAALDDARVLDLVSGHGGRVLQRARSNGADGQPLEIQLLEFPSAAALDDYMTDGRRLSLSDERDRAIARTQVIDVELIQVG